VAHLADSAKLRYEVLEWATCEPLRFWCCLSDAK